MSILVAGEESGDRLGAALMRALKERTGGQVRFAGVGGHGMASEGLTSLFPLDELSIIGFSAILRRLPAILRRIRETVDAVVASSPDVLVIIDSPEFTQRVAQRVRAAAPTIPIVDYVSPSVWAWRPGRARKMRAYVDHILALLPFEPDAHRRLGGPPCTYVGHPLTQEIAELRPNADEARRRLASPPVLLVLPGSRSGEIQRLMGTFAETVALVAGKIGAVEIVLPTTPRLADAREGGGGKLGSQAADRRRRSTRNVRPSASPAPRWRSPAPSRSSLRWRACRWSRPTRCPGSKR